MRTIFTLCLLSLCACAAAQHVTIRLKSGERKTVTANANTPTALFTSDGMIRYIDIDSLTFHGYEATYDGLRDRLVTNGVKVTVGDKRVEEVPVASPLLTVSPQPHDLDPIAIDKFLDQRSAGKMLQFLGVVAFGVASYLATSDADDDYSDVQKALPWAGLGAMGFGLVIDIDAGKHLRRR